MGNRIQIKHGSRVPELNDLAPFELGYVHGGALYIRNGATIAQLTGPEVNDLVKDGKITKSQFVNIRKSALKQDKILVCDSSNELLYRAPEEILEDINGFSKNGGEIDGDILVNGNLNVKKQAEIKSILNVEGQSNFENGVKVNGILTTGDAFVLKEGVSYGYADPNEEGISGIEGQVYFVLMN